MGKCTCDYDHVNNDEHRPDCGKNAMSDADKLHVMALGLELCVEDPSCQCKECDTFREEAALLRRAGFACAALTTQRAAIAEAVEAMKAAVLICQGLFDYPEQAVEARKRLDSALASLTKYLEQEPT